MAKKKLNSIVWPNIPDDVYYLDADKVEYDDTETYSEGSVGDALQNKANIDGSYENLTAGNAEQLVTGIRANDQTPYLFRTAGGSVDIGDREYINGIVGVSAPWNQLVQNGNFADTSVWQISNGSMQVSDNVGTITATSAGGEFVYQAINVPEGHKVFVTATIKGDATHNSYLSFGTTNFKTYTVNTSWDTVSAVTQKTSSQNFNVIRISDGVSAGEKFYAKNVMLIDLTQMFGSTIADYIYSLEQANAGTGVAWIKSHGFLTKPYYAYNSGELKSVRGLVSHDMVGFNAWDEEWEVGAIGSNGSNSSSSSNIRSKNYIPVIPNTTYYYRTAYTSSGGYPLLYYYDKDKNLVGSTSISKNVTFTTPQDAYYMRFFVQSSYGATYNHDICINLSWDGSEDGNYQPYQKWSYPLGDVTLRGVPKISNGQLYYDGDTYEADGTVTRKYGVVDLGTLNWEYNIASMGAFTSNGLTSVIASRNAVCSRYVIYSTSSSSAITNLDKMLFINKGESSTGNLGAGTIAIKDSAYSTVEAFKTAMSGVYLVYELATPITESADPYTSPQIVNDFGTEEFVISNTVDVPIPVGHNTDYPINLKAQVEMMPHSPDGDGDYIVRQTNGTNEYVSIANNATIQNILARLEALEG